MVQLSTDDRNRGLVLGLWSMVIHGALPLGNLLAGEAADRWGESLVLCGQGLACLAAALVTASAAAGLRAARRARRPEPGRPRPSAQ